MTDFIYDIEVLPNVFTCDFENDETGEITTFEISPRRNEVIEFNTFMNVLAVRGDRMVGFNNIHYDYPVIHYLMTILKGDTNAKRITQNLYNKSKAIFKDSVFNPFAHSVWESNHIVQQIDLYKIHHFDNVARRTSLKRLQFNMRLRNIQEFEIPFDENIKNSSVIKKLVNYNRHDVMSTRRFCKLSRSQIRFREVMSVKQGKSYLNYNDTKIGEEYFVSELKKVIDEDCFVTYTTEGKKKKRTTPRPVMSIKDLLFDYVKLETPEFKGVLDKMKAMTMFSIKGKFHWNEHKDYPVQIEKIKPMKSELKLLEGDDKKKAKEELDLFTEKYNNKELTCVADGVKFVFGKGGLHASLNNTIRYSTKDRLIIDVDVTSYYPSVGIENNLYPEHLTSAFCPVYTQQKKMREKYKKGTNENAMLKLALNGSYGKTNSEFSVLCDPLYTVTTTLNGQLLLAMLWEELRKISGIDLIQVNTDGITFEIDKTTKKQVKDVCVKWEKLTKLNLESVVYKRMWIRDGNNYIAEYTNGKLKSKGAYVHQSLYDGSHEDGIEWHKNHSMMIVQKAVEAELVRGIPANKFIIEHDNIFDFFLCTNVNRTCELMIGDGYIPAEKYKGDMIVPPHLGFLNKQIQRVTRYLITNSDDQLTKVMPPLRGGSERYIGINVGYHVTTHNKIPKSQSTNPNEHDYDINYDFYIREANKLLKPFK